MRYKHFINADIDASVMSVGTWAIGDFGYGDVNEKDSIAAIRETIAGGVNLIDTAPIYGAGHSEIVCGKAIKGYDREKLLISTKFGSGGTTLKGIRNSIKSCRDASYANVLYECECSLRRLDTDYIDIYFVHWPDPETPIEETMTALNKLKEQGKIRFIGVSNYNKEMILEAEKYAKVDVIQPPYSMVARRDEELMKWCMERGIDSLTYGSLGSGILTGKYREIPTFNPGDPRNGFYPFFREPAFSKVMKALEVLDEISEETGKPLSQIVINWTTQKDYVSTALCGVRTPEQAKENCETFSWSLNDAQMAKIDEAVNRYLDFDGTTPVRK